jgi:hypothetical protein
VAEGIIWLAGTLTTNEAISRVGSLAFLTTVALHFLVFQVNRFIMRSSRRRYAVLIFYGAALLVWLLGRWIGHQPLTNVGWSAFAVIAGIHVASNVGRLWPLFRWLVPALVGLLTLTFVAVFALGLIYLGVFEPGNWVAELIRMVQQLISP